MKNLIQTKPLLPHISVFNVLKRMKGGNDTTLVCHGNVIKFLDDTFR